MTTILDRVRHPEKAHRPASEILRKPSWIRVSRAEGPAYGETRGILRSKGLSTVCEEAACPNRGECWSQRHATMMIMGSICTRGCAFCNVATGRPDPLDAEEPRKVALAVAELGLRHVVLTSVDRDDLEDGGAMHFAKTIRSVRNQNPLTSIEVLVPDFRHKGDAWVHVVNAAPDVFNHNLECVPRLYPSVRPGARYYQSLRLLDHVKSRKPDMFTKSGLMVGLGETFEELRQVMDDMRVAGVDFITVGQYLQPTAHHHRVDRFLPPDEFQRIEDMARAKGFLAVSATPMTRSSFHAAGDFEKLRSARRAQLLSKDSTHG